jgi:hypothetical protein
MAGAQLPQGRGDRPISADRDEGYGDRRVPVSAANGDFKEPFERASEVTSVKDR